MGRGNKRRTAGWLLCLVLLLCGCGLSGPETMSWEAVDPADREESRAENLGFRPDPVPDLTEEFSGAAPYYYGQLTGAEQETYRQMYAAIREMDPEEVRLVLTEEARIGDLYQYILYDHPELFWAESYRLCTYQQAGKVLGYSFAGQYNCSLKEAADKKLAILTRTEEILSEAPLGGSDYEKIKFVYEAVIRNTVYDRSAPDHQNISSVLLNGASVCQGYALTAQYLLERMGIRAVTVSGKASGELHAWNVVWSDGEPYCMDVTWGDPQFVRQEDGQVLSPEEGISYDYLLVTGAELALTHEAESCYPLPDCTATADQYYRREGLLLETWDPEPFLAIVIRCLEEEKDEWTVRFADETGYQQAQVCLIEKQEIYEYLQKASEETGAVFDTGRIQYGLDDGRQQIRFRLLRQERGEEYE